MRSKRPPDPARIAAPLGFHLGFPAVDVEVRRSMVLIHNLLTDMGVPPEGIELAELVLAEALNNVVEHACTGTIGALVEIDVRCDESHLDCLIRDQGRPLPDRQVPRGGKAKIDVPQQELPEGGFGWMLIHKLTDSISYQRSGRKNHLSLRIPIRPALALTPAPVAQ
jgi:serine/threonine-protein kinase RsbW